MVGNDSSTLDKGLIRQISGLRVMGPPGDEGAPYLSRGGGGLLANRGPGSASLLPDPLQPQPNHSSLYGNCRSSLYRRTNEPKEHIGPAMKKITLLLITLLTFQLGLITPLPAQVYKYVDKNGISHYTNTPNDPKYMKSKIGVSDPKKKNRPAVKKAPRYRRAPHPAKSPVSPSKR